MASKILRNAARCLKCNDEIDSRYRHDFVTCSCGNISVDGGKDYIRRVFRTDQWEEISEHENYVEPVQPPEPKDTMRPEYDFSKAQRGSTPSKSQEKRIAATKKAARKKKGTKR